MANDLTIDIAAPDADDAWDAYVKDSRHGRFFHRTGWRKIIKSVYGYDSYNLIARKAGKVVGVLPLIDVKSPLMGRNLVSTAFTVGGGILGDNAEIESALADAAVEEGRRRRVKYVELRSERETLEEWPTKKDIYAGFEKIIPPDEDDNLKMIPRKRRAEVRKACKAQAEGKLNYKITKNVDVFYDLYGQALRDHGTPIFPKKFAQALAGEFIDDMEIIEIYAGDQAVLALLTFYGHGRTMPYYFGARRDARAHRAFDLSVWLQMRRGLERGFPIFDFGRSKYGTGSFDFKQYWGFEPVPLEYQYALVNADEVPNVNPKNPKFALVSKLWTKLPVPIANIAGPILARHLA